jgi:hypothetical protein
MHQGRSLRMKMEWVIVDAGRLSQRFIKNTTEIAEIVGQQ